MDKYLSHNEVYGIVICRQHRYAITPASVARHFQEYHKSVPIDLRKQLQDYVDSLGLSNPDNVDIPNNTVPIHGLPIHKGFKCGYENCLELRRSEKSMKLHCGTKHAWKLKANGVKWTEQAIQTFFEGSYLKYVSHRLY